MFEGQYLHRRSDPDVFRNHGDGAGHRIGRGAHAVFAVDVRYVGNRRKMVLGQPHRVESYLVGQLYLLDMLCVDLRFGLRKRLFHQVKCAEFHALCLRRSACISQL